MTTPPKQVDRRGGVRRDVNHEFRSVEEFIAEYTSDGAWGPEGYLADKGLIPLPDAERAKVGEDAKALKPMGS